MLALSEFSIDCISGVFLIITIWGLMTWVYRGIIRDNIVATCDDIEDAYREGFKDGNSDRFENACDGWINSKTHTYHVMMGHFDD